MLMHLKNGKGGKMKLNKKGGISEIIGWAIIIIIFVIALQQIGWIN
jgi:hypothetical protein